MLLGFVTGSRRTVPIFGKIQNYNTLRQRSRVVFYSYCRVLILKKLGYFVCLKFVFEPDVPGVSPNFFTLLGGEVRRERISIAP